MKLGASDGAKNGENLETWDLSLGTCDISLEFGSLGFGFWLLSQLQFFARTRAGCIIIKVVCMCE